MRALQQKVVALLSQRRKKRKIFALLQYLLPTYSLSLALVANKNGGKMGHLKDYLPKKVCSPIWSTPLTNFLFEVFCLSKATTFTNTILNRTSFLGANLKTKLCHHYFYKTLLAILHYEVRTTISYDTKKNFSNFFLLTIYTMVHAA